MKFTVKSIGMLACASLLGLSLVGCAGGAGKQGDASGSTPAAAAKDNKKGGIEVNLKPIDYTKASYDQLKDGGELHFSITELTAQGNIFQQDSTLYSNVIWNWYNPQVILFDDSFEPQINPDYLSGIKEETKDGKTVVTYTINPNAKWNDGTPIDWTAFETTWIINNGKDKNYAPNSTDGYQDIESVTRGANDKEAVVTFDKIYVWYYGLFNNLAYPALKDYNTYKEGYLKTVHNEWGAGPYMVENYDPNAGVISFVKNPKWWGKPGKLDRITYTQMEASAELNAFKNGEIDAVGSISSKERYEAVKDVPNTKIYTAGSTSSSVFMLNAESEPLKDPRVREAIFTARDRKQLAKIAYNGLNYDAPDAGSFTLFPGQKGYHDNFSEVVKFDPERSKKLLDEAGWVPGADGIREKDGKRLELSYPLFGDSQTRRAGYLATQKMMKDVGIDLKIVEYPAKEFSNVYTKRQFDVFSLGFSSSDPFGVAYFGQIYGSDSGLNLSKTGTPEFDQKIKELQQIGDKDKQIARANELEVEAFRLFGIMPGSIGPDMTIVKDGLANVGSLSFHTVAKENIGWLK